MAPADDRTPLGAKPSTGTVIGGDGYVQDQHLKS